MLQGWGLEGWGLGLAEFIWDQKDSRRLWRSQRRKSSSVPEGEANFPAAIFLAGKCPNLGRDSISCCRKIGEEFLRNVPVTPTPSIFPKVLLYKWGAYCRTNGGGVLPYFLEAYCRVSLSSKLRSQESTAIQMGGVLPYKLEVYCRTF